MTNILHALLFFSASIFAVSLAQNGWTTGNKFLLGIVLVALLLRVVAHRRKV
jgi:hypothetical protein